MHACDCGHAFRFDRGMRVSKAFQDCRGSWNGGDAQASSSTSANEWMVGYVLLKMSPPLLQAVLSLPAAVVVGCLIRPTSDDPIPCHRPHAGECRSEMREWSGRCISQWSGYGDTCTLDDSLHARASRVFEGSESQERPARCKAEQRRVGLDKALVLAHFAGEGGSRLVAFCARRHTGCMPLHGRFAHLVFPFVRAPLSCPV